MPGRALAALAALIVVLLLAILGGNIFSPASWHKDFKVKLGLDLTQGTEVSLVALTPKQKPASPTEMQQAIQIMNDRVNAAGFTETQVQQQGNNIINVSIPGQENQKVVQLVSQSAELEFRQVLLAMPNSLAAQPTPSPSPSGVPSPSTTPSTTPSSHVSSHPSPTPSGSAHAAGAPGQGSGAGTEMAHSARGLAAGAAAAPQASPSASPSPSATPSGSASASPSASAPAPSGTHLSTWQDSLANPTGFGNAALLSPKVKALFNKLNCADKNWPTKVGYSPEQLNDQVKDQVVSCGTLGGVPVKYALDKAKVVGTEVGSASAQLPSTSASSWEVLVNFKGGGGAAFGALTTQMYDQFHGSNQDAQNQLGMVLDGDVISAPNIQQPITGGQAQVTGGFSQSQASQLANELNYGALPLTFKQQQVVTVSPQLGHDQLDAGLIAAGIGLILVVFYLLFYYRGLAVVAVSSLVIAALLSYLAVVTLGKYAGFALNLAGVAGLIVAIGITADSFVVFFERLRDEVREGGRSLRAAVERGWTRARRTILVSDTVSFLAAALLYYFSIGDVKGFAFTLGMITIVDIVVVFTFTKPMLTLLARTKFFGSGHPLSGLDPKRLGARAPWRGTPRPVGARGARPSTAQASRPGTPKEA